MCAVCHNGGRDDGQSAGTKYNEHNHGVGSLGFICVECLEFAHGFEPHWGSGIVEPEHVGGEIHEHGAIDRVVVGYLGEDAAKERCNATREGVGYATLLSDIENTHPEGEHTSKSDGDFKTILGRGEGGVENLGEDFTLPKKEKLHAAHDDCEKNKSYPNIVEQHKSSKVLSAACRCSKSSNFATKVQLFLHMSKKNSTFARLYEEKCVFISCELVVEAPTDRPKYGWAWSAFTLFV